MPTFKKEMNYALSKYQMKPEDTAHLKKILLEITQDIYSTAAQNGITCYLAYGSLLGAVRHKGFIPWDDDVDLWVKIEEIPTLLQKIKERFGEKYYFSGLNFGKSDDPVHVVKIMLSGTTQIEIQKVNAPGEKGIFVDIMPIFHTKKSRFGRYLHGKRYVLLYHICAVVYDYKYPSPLLAEVENNNKKFRHYYQLRRFLGFCFSFLSLHHWITKQRRFIEKKHGNSQNLATDGVGFKTKQPLRKEDFATEEYPFENKHFASVKNFDRFLTEIYGNTYMTPPADSDKEVHLCYKIDFGPY